MVFQKSDRIIDRIFTDRKQIERLKYLTTWGRAYSL
jgi:hypothetical protein